MATTVKKITRTLQLAIVTIYYTFCIVHRIYQV